MSVECRRIFVRFGKGGDILVSGPGVRSAPPYLNVAQISTWTTESRVSNLGISSRDPNPFEVPRNFRNLDPAPEHSRLKAGTIYGTLAIREH